MNKALIITGYLPYNNKDFCQNLEFDKVFCADKGYYIGKELGFNPDFVIGDFDSSIEPDIKEKIVLPSEKDMTDTEAALDYAITQGFKTITILGGLGGRFDHALGNIALLLKYKEKDVQIEIMDEQNLVFLATKGSYTIPKLNYKYLGLISYSDIVSGICLSNVKYPLNNFSLKNNTSLGVSNEILNDKAYLSVDKGDLLVIRSNDRPSPCI